MMNIPKFHVRMKEDEIKTLADLPEWTVAVCDFLPHMQNAMRFRVGKFAYSADEHNRSPVKEYLASEYHVRKIIGPILCNC